MDEDILKICGVIWFGIVLSVLTVFTLCKIGGAWFNMPPAHSGVAQGTRERMYDACLSNTEANHSDQCNYVLKEVQ